MVLQEAHERGLKTYLMGLPKEKSSLLPTYISAIKDIGSVQDNSAILFDESYLYAYARDHPKSFNKYLNKIIGVTRQKDWLLIFNSHTARKLDVGVVLDMDNIIIREPSWLHARYERIEIRKLIRASYGFFRHKRDPVKHAVIFTTRGSVAVELGLPSFWTEQLSRAFSGLTLDEM